jgi:serine/threonine protein kinase
MDSDLEETLGTQDGAQAVLASLVSGEAQPQSRYTVTQLHANGGIGRVWLARDAALGRQIALKELRPDQAADSTACARFLYEARITAQLEHPGIVPVYELGEGQRPYYTMRFVRGRTLAESIRAYHRSTAAGKPDPVAMVELLTAFVGVCHAVAFAHSRGIIHRDLKGQNVVLGDFGEVIVVDWGLAKRISPEPVHGGPMPRSPNDSSPAHTSAPVTANSIETGERAQTSAGDTVDPRDAAATTPPALDAREASHSATRLLDADTGAGSVSGRESPADSARTLPGQLLGTPAYMAPEQARGRHDQVDGRTDVYGLGAILYEILTGRPPFEASATSDLVRKVPEEAPTPPRQIVGAVAPGLEAVCLKAMCKDQAGRYASAAELGQDVQRYLADEPVAAYVEPWTRHAMRWARRHRTAVAASAGLLVTATIALAVSTAFIAREKNEVQLQRNEARLQKMEAELQGQQARQAVHLLTRGVDTAFDDQLDPLQKEFLANALGYYEKFTARAARDPAVRLEHARTYEQMGNIQRRLGRLPDSESAYRRALELLKPLAAVPGVQRDAEQTLARTQTLLANLLVRRGGESSQAAALYSQARAIQERLADARHNAAATADDDLFLGQTLRSQADLLRLDGRFTDARPVYARAKNAVEEALAAARDRAEIRDELALTLDALEWIHRELGELAQAERDYHHALELLEPLVAEFPTVPRHRQVLAKVCNSLALIEEDTGRLADAEAHLRRELLQVERLVQDYPERPEHRRELARTLMNLGNVLDAQSRSADAEPMLRRAIDVNAAIAAKNPHDVQIRLDLSKCHNNLGELLRKKGDARHAHASFLRSRSISQALVKAFPDKPRYSEELAGTLGNLALALEVVDPPQVEATYRASLAIYEKLVADHPDNAGYRIGQARCLRNFGPVLANAKRTAEAETVYRKALALLEIKGSDDRAPEDARDRASVLNNLGELQLECLRWQAGEESLRSAMAIFENLAARKGSTFDDRHLLAIAQNNLGDLLVKRERFAEAAPLLASALQQFEKLVAEAPRSIDCQSHFGIVLAGHAKLLDVTSRPADARASCLAAIEHQRQAVLLSKNQPAFRQLLGEHLLELANLELKLGAYDNAAERALELPGAVPPSVRAQACYDAAGVLARAVDRIAADPKLPEATRDRLIRNDLARAAILLREAIDTNPKLAGKVSQEAQFRQLKSRSEFQTILNVLVDAGR